jgi:hypothetical protein
MGDSRFRLSSRGALLAAISAAFPLPGLAAPAARVEFAVGDPQLARPGGVAAPLAKGAEVSSGDTIITNKGRVQLRFSDGAYVSLQPGSEFRVDDYRFEGRTDGSERGVFSLLKGGLRTITGLVGRTNKKAYQVNTSVATIGIRGTEYTIAYTNSLSGSVGEGEIEACNGGGCSNFTNGESFFIPSPEIRPALTDKKTDLPPQQPGDDPGGRFQSANDPTKPNGSGTNPAFAAGDQTTEAGLPAGVLLTGSQANWVYRQDGFSNFLSSMVMAGPLVLDDRGAATSVAAAELQTIVAGNNGLITWGRAFSPTSSEFLYYAGGAAVPPGDLSTLALNRVVGTYQLIQGAGPGPTASWRGGPTAGAFASGALTADFTAAKATLDLGMRFDFNKPGEALAANVVGVALQGVGKMDLTNAQFGHTPFGSTFVFSTGGSCSVAGGGSCSFLGLFGGAGAKAAAVVIEANTTAVIGGSTESLSINGAAGFQRR